jgi:MFS family permease
MVFILCWFCILFIFVLCTTDDANFAKFFQVTPTHSSFPLSFSTVALAIGLLFTGFISDRFGRKPIMVLPYSSFRFLID